MVNDPKQDIDPSSPEPPRVDPEPDPDDPRKERVPSGPVPPTPDRPDEPPAGNGGTDEPAAFPPHN
jgi:hypothetical protein